MNLLIPFIPVIVFFAALKGHQLGFLNWIVAALLSTIIPFIITGFLGFLLSSGTFTFDILFNAVSLVTLATQTVTALGIFRYIEYREESTTAWITAAILGSLVIYFAIPYIVSRLILG